MLFGGLQRQIRGAPLAWLGVNPGAGRPFPSGGYSSLPTCAGYSEGQSACLFQRRLVTLVVCLLSHEVPCSDVASFFTRRIVTPE